jgi:hypothetical protein
LDVQVDISEARRWIGYNGNLNATEKRLKVKFTERGNSIFCHIGLQALEKKSTSKCTARHNAEFYQY